MQQHERDNDAAHENAGSNGPKHHDNAGALFPSCLAWKEYLSKKSDQRVVFSADHGFIKSVVRIRFCQSAPGPAAKNATEKIAGHSFWRVSQNPPRVKGPSRAFLSHLPTTTKINISIAAAEKPVETASITPEAKRRKNGATKQSFSDAN